MQKSSSIWSKTFVQLLAMEVCLQFGFYLINPITANYSIDLGSNLAMAGFIASISAWAALILRFFSGAFLSRKPIKRMLVVAAALYAASSLIAGFVPLVSVLAGTRLLLGAAIVIKTTLAIVYATVISPKDATGRAVATISLTDVVANALGPSVAAYIGAAFGFGTSFIISGIILVVGVLLGLTLPEIGSKNDADAAAAAEGEPADAASETAEVVEVAQPSRFKSALGKVVNLQTLPLAIYSVTEAFMFSTLAALLILIGQQRGLDNVSLFFLVYVVVAVVARPFTSRLYDRHGYKKVCIPMAASMALAFLVLMFTHGMVMLMLAALLFAMGQGCLFPCMQVESVKGVPQEKMVLASNTFYLGIDIGMAVGPLVSGVLLEAFGPTVTLGVNFFLGIVFFVTSFNYCRYMRKRGLH